MNFSKKICKDDGQEQCELLSDCKNITVLKTPFYGIVEHFHLYCGDDAYSATLVITFSINKIRIVIFSQKRFFSNDSNMCTISS